MARVRSLQQGEQQLKVHLSEVDCFYQVVESSSGERYVHLSTFGSDERHSKPKSSQSMQLDAVLAAELIDVLRRAFPGACAALPG